MITDAFAARSEVDNMYSRWARLPSWERDARYADDERRLFEDVLYAIANELCDDPALLAQEALRSLRVNTERRYHGRTP